MSTDFPRENCQENPLTLYSPLSISSLSVSDSLLLLPSESVSSFLSALEYTVQAKLALTLKSIRLFLIQFVGIIFAQ